MRSSPPSRNRKSSAKSEFKNQKSKIAGLVRALLGWFEKKARDLPWRRTTDPYAIWVSEIMLQQTQVKTVLGYWERWMRALPSVGDLAKAKPATIHKLWEGLGYYTRVRNMQKAAQQIMSEHGGEFPKDYDAILELPGIGRYTAGAIASIAFNEPRPILDGNVTRVLARLFGIEGKVRERPANERLWKLAEELVVVAKRKSSGDARYCSHLNQSLMELGALICTPREPKCSICPVQNNCEALRTGRIEKLPNVGKRVASTPRWFVAFVLEHRGKYLVRQRPAGVVNAHLWEFPNLEIRPRASIGEEGQRMLSSATAELGLKPRVLQPLCIIKHTITRYRMTLEVYRGEIKSGPTDSAMEGTWLTTGALRKLAFTSAHRRILNSL